MTIHRAIELYNEGCITAPALEQIAALNSATILYQSGRAIAA